MATSEQKERLAAISGSPVWMALPIVSLILAVGFTAHVGNDLKSVAQVTKDQAEQNAIRQLRFLAKAVEISAVEVDRRGIVTWCNSVAVKRFGVKVGQDVESIMPAEGADRHRSQFAIAMERNSGGVQSLASINCVAISPDGPIPVHVETWTTPEGAMAFITERQPE